MIRACPTTTIAAPIEIVWSLLVTPAEYDTWVDARVERIVPPGSACPGQEVDLRGRAAGRRWTMRIMVEDADAGSGIFAFRAELPLGVRLKERISCVKVGGETRVQFG
ncbi:MAG TPA: SRPBCC family protein [Candidatus Limnocylindria bacterium]|jgi:hypothetical protein